MKPLLNDHEDCPNQHKNSHKLCNEMGKSMRTETTWSEFPDGGKAIAEHILVSEEKINPKEHGCENVSLGSG